jgi:hypothetical protein
MSDTTSLVKVLDDIVDKNISDTKPMTVNVVILYEAGSQLTAIDLGTLSY